MQEIDKSIIELGIKGDKEAFKLLYTHYAPFVWRLILRMTADQTKARELLQETFVKIHGAIHKFKGNSAFSTWVYKIARNVVLADVRRIRLFRTHESYQENIVGPYRADSFNSKDLVDKIMATLSLDDRFLLIAREIDGLSFEEIADITGVSEGALRTKLHRLKENIKKNFNTPFEREACA
ncbi:MAG: sigma-70 family RNA polymerase sigma factor [Fibrobacter sp.]|nr:sigma-70 family RNA polymerase sigma factor [Fibrobacter sp.]